MSSLIKDGKQGEKIVYNFLEKNLLDWEIYSQPHLNGTKPDFVCLNPEKGILIIEVKDWNLDAYSVDRDHKITITDTNISFAIPNPLSQVQKYKDHVMSLYCPRLGINNNSITVINCGIIFPFEEENKIQKFLDNFKDHNQFKYTTFCGKESIQSNNFSKIFKNNKTSYYMSKEAADDIRSWLIEPDYSAEQKEDIELDEKQKLIITSRSDSGFRRIRGAAGTGKSLIIAGRALELVKNKKEVMVISFNITLIHYLRDICSRIYRRPRNKIAWKTFHDWMKELSYDLNIEKEYKKVWSNHFENSKIPENKNYILTYLLPKLLISHINNNLTNNDQKYDAILVDEGQDFDPTWWTLLRKFLKPNGEMLLVVDSTQNIYDRPTTNWTDVVMVGSGFTGKWIELHTSYRLPPTLVPLLKIFIENYLNYEENLIPIPEQTEFDFYPCEVDWIQVNKNNSIEKIINEMMTIISEDEKSDRAFTDLTFITDDNDTGLSIVEELKNKKINSVHTYKYKDEKDGRKSRNRKLSFWKGDARVKATTIHSFKGWEGRFIIMNISKAKTKKDLSIVYTALTRVKKHKNGSFLKVICSEEKLASYGKHWCNKDK